MDSTPLYPLRFQPILRRLIWGGRRLGSVLHKPIGPETDYAESWEIADYHEHVSVVADGPLAGTTLRELLESRPDEVLGASVSASGQFPLLVKFIDARQTLSVQVHPDDEKGRRLANDNGKTETWIILEADADSKIYAGLKAGVTAEQFREAIESDRVEPLLHQFHPARGDSILIEAGTVHAIGAGIVLAEIQQMSDATFRVYDWGRTDQNGKPRALHIEQALESTDFTRGPVEAAVPTAEPIRGGTRERLAESGYFVTERLTLDGPATVGAADRFTILLGLEGAAEIVHGSERFGLGYGQTLLLPAAIGPCDIVPQGKAQVLTCAIP
jgi:mannose-6-phosphate isomerase